MWWSLVGSLSCLMVCESGGQQLDPGPAIWFVGVVVISWCPGHVM